MQISAATMLATQNTTAARPADQSAEFAPLLFKKSAPVQAAAPAASESVSTTATPVFAGAAASSAKPGGYVRPGSQIDIKV